MMNEIQFDNNGTPATAVRAQAKGLDAVCYRCEAFGGMEIEFPADTNETDIVTAFEDAMQPQLAQQENDDNN